jgi:hypothetical protein
MKEDDDREDDDREDDDDDDDDEAAELTKLMSRVTLRNTKMHEVIAYYDDLIKKIAKEKRHALRRVKGYKQTYMNDLMNVGNLERHKFPPKMVLNPRHISLARTHMRWGYRMCFGTTMLDLDNDTLCCIARHLLAGADVPVHPRVVHVTKTPAQLIALKLVCKKWWLVVECLCAQL